jgi:hypothetical protein
MRKRLLLAAALVLLMNPTAASAQDGTGCQRPSSLTSPFVFATVNGTCTDLSSMITPNTGGKGWNLLGSTTLGGNLVDLTGTFNPDPFITFGATTTNSVNGPVTYAFLFGTPIVPGFYNAASSTGGVSVTDPQGAGTTVSPSGVYPTYISGYGTVGLAATNLGVDLGTAPCVATGSPATTTCNQGTRSNTFAPTFYDNLEALLTYDQTTIGSVASWSGAVTLTNTTVPEPATLSLFGTGIALLGGFLSRRRFR